MQYRRLGKSGLKLSALSYGSWVTFGSQVDLRRAKEFMALAYDAGVNFFDNAEVYEDGQSEILMGQALQELGFARDTFCVSSKVFWGGEKPTQLGLSRKHVVEACHAALKRLRVEYLDLYFCHRPDPETPIEETARAMDDLVTQGKILYWGTSEWSAEQLTQAYSICHKNGFVPPTMEQPEYNLFKRSRVEQEYAGFYQEHGLGTTIWSPLASGILSGKYSNGIPHDSRMNIDGYEFLRYKVQSQEGKIKIEKTKQMKKIADQEGCTLSQLAIAWCLKNLNVSTVILGASRLEQLKENLQAYEVYAKINSRPNQTVFIELESIASSAFQ